MIGKFCKECGSPLDMNGRCPQCKPSRIVAEPEPREDTPSSANLSAPSFSLGELVSSIGEFMKSFLDKVKTRMGVGASPLESSLNVFEWNTSIVPDKVKPNDGEIPIKQYKVATLRSRIRGQRAEGRLQVTNKRLIFRAAGTSLMGRTTLQQEFAIDNIAGVEVRKSHRCSILSFIGGLLLSGMIDSVVRSWFRAFYGAAPVWAAIVAIIVALGSVVPFFVLRRKFWLKMSSLSVGAGALLGTTPAVSSLQGLVNSPAAIPTVLCGVLILVVGCINLLLLSFVPDLTLTIKTNSPGPAVEIRRKFWGMFSPVRENDYTGFSEVIPGEDVDKMVSEIGAMIDDIKTMGDYAIEKWKEEGQSDD